MGRGKERSRGEVAGCWRARKEGRPEGKVCKYRLRTARTKPRLFVGSSRSQPNAVPRPRRRFTFEKICSSGKSKGRSVFRVPLGRLLAESAGWTQTALVEFVRILLRTDGTSLADLFLQDW